MGTWTLVKGACKFCERRAGWFLVGGLALALAWNGRQWLRDRRRLRQLKARAPEESSLGKTPLVSILLPAWNEGHNLGACIEAILALRYPEIELVVCAGGQDATLAIGRAYGDQGIIVLEQHAGEGKQRALRRCFERSTGEAIFLTDADCLLDDASFQATLTPVVAGGEAAATGSWRPLDRQAAHPLVQFQWADHLYREIWMPGYAPTLDGRNAAVRRAALEAVAAFDVDAPIGTDYVLSRQLAAAGYRIRFVQGSRVQTEYPGTVQAYFQQRSRWLRTPVLAGWRWGDRAQLQTQLRGGLVAGFLLGVPAVGGLGSRALWALWLAVACHLWLAAARVARLMELAVGWPLAARRYAFLPAYLVIGWSATVRGLADTLIPRRRWRW